MLRKASRQTSSARKKRGGGVGRGPPPPTPPPEAEGEGKERDKVKDEGEEQGGQGSPPPPEQEEEGQMRRWFPVLASCCGSSKYSDVSIPSFCNQQVKSGEPRVRDEQLGLMEYENRISADVGGSSSHYPLSIHRSSS